MATVSLPPMLQLYLDYKAKNPDSLLFFQVGDFFELFFEDAKITAQCLNLTLTSRDKNSQNPVPMCGVPIAVVDSYVQRLVDQGHSVALVKQVGDPKAQKGMVERALDRIVTPGVRILAGSESESEASVVAFVSIGDDQEVSVAFSDVRTGRISVIDRIAHEKLFFEIGKIAPQEVVLPRSDRGKVIDRRSGWVKRIENSVQNKKGSIKFRTPQLSVAPWLIALNGYSTLSPLAKSAVHGLVSYIEEVVVGSQVRFSQVCLYNESDVLVIDSVSRDHLELVRSSRGNTEQGTLLSAINGCVTSCGARMLHNWILGPLRNEIEIDRRLQAVELLISKNQLRADLRSLMTNFADLERIATRIEVGVVSPRELGALRDGLFNAIAISKLLSELNDDSILRQLGSVLDVEALKLDLLQKALSDNPPLTVGEGGVFRTGFDGELDRLRKIKNGGHTLMAEIEAKEREETGISSLKVRYNNVFGYFIEVTKANISKVPERYIRRQTTTNSERYITPEIKAIEEEIFGADSALLTREREQFAILINQIFSSTGVYRMVGESIAHTDILSAFAHLAALRNWVRPEIVGEPVIDIVQGSHPVLQEILGQDLVPNDMQLLPGSNLIKIITGPNMGGKSTYLRQAALLVIMAQVGSFVPANSAKLGLVDRIFTRIGAADNMAEGESTFMVEMRETAQILNSATSRSLVLIDEVGRGTATTDGISLAQAILEWIVSRIGCRTLFATHFHDLTRLVEEHNSIGNLSVGSDENDGQILFTYQIVDGPADRSYGLEVAKLAGLPEELIVRAQKLLDETVSQENQEDRQLSFFSATSSKSSGKRALESGKPPLKSRIEVSYPADYEHLLQIKERVTNIDINKLTPLDALNALSELVDETKHKN